MNKRNFSSDSVAKLMNNGTKYTDNRGSKILYDAASKTALVVDKSREPVITALDKVDIIQKIANAGWKPGW